MVSELIKLPTWQVRNKEYDPGHLKKIKGKIRDAGGSHTNTNPIIILDDRLNSEIYTETDLRIDVAHTLESERTEGCVYGYTRRLPKEAHEHLSHTEVERVASLLNRDPEIVKLPNGVKVKIEFKGLTFKPKKGADVFLDRKEMMTFFKATEKYMK